MKKAGDTASLPTLGGMQQRHLVGQELMEAKRLQVFVHTNHCGVSSPGGPFGGASSREGKVAASNYVREEEEEESRKQM